MSILLTPFVCDPLCHGNTWTIDDENVLASQIAYIAVGQSRHIQRILAGANLGPSHATSNSAIDAINLLTKTLDNPWHRDGWMFQAMSWIAARKADPNGIIHAPHIIAADKGFDGLQLVLDYDAETVSAAVIFEDKTANNSRTTIKEKVWPELEKFEAGHQENVLTSEITSLLQTQHDINVDKAIEKIIWEEVRHYRVSVNVADTHSHDQGRRRLFKGYDTIVGGDLVRRQAGTFHKDDFRLWMDSLAQRSIDAVNSMVVPNV